MGYEIFRNTLLIIGCVMSLVESYGAGNTVTVSVFLCGCGTWSLMFRMYITSVSKRGGIKG
jgi:hypothetical protein